MAVTLKNAYMYHLRPRHFDPKYIPSSLEEVFGSEVYLHEITLTNSTTSAVLVTIQDKQATPLPVLKDVSVPAKGVYVVRFEGRYCPGGLSWQADQASAVVGYIRGRT